MLNTPKNDIYNKYPPFTQRHQSFPASITVEAAFVMPLVILTIFALIYLSYYLHDVCKLQNQVDYTLHQAGISLKHETDILTGEIKYEDINDRGVYYLITGDAKSEGKLLQKELEQQLSKGLLFMKVSEVMVDVGKFSLSVSINASCKVTLPIFHELFASISNITIRGDYPIHNPAETIRQCEVILDTASDIKGVDKLKKKIEEFLDKKE